MKIIKVNSLSFSLSLFASKKKSEKLAEGNGPWHLQASTMVSLEPYLLPNLDQRDNQKTFCRKYSSGLKTMIPIRLRAR